MLVFVIESVKTESNNKAWVQYLSVCRKAVSHDSLQQIKYWGNDGYDQK